MLESLWNHNKSPLRSRVAKACCGREKHRRPSWNLVEWSGFKWKVCVYIYIMPVFLVDLQINQSWFKVLPIIQFAKSGRKCAPQSSHSFPAQPVSPPSTTITGHLLSWRDDLIKSWPEIRKPFFNVPAIWMFFVNVPLKSVFLPIETCGFIFSPGLFPPISARTWRPGARSRDRIFERHPPSKEFEPP